MATEYIVLERNEDGAWRERQTVFANSAEQAIRLVIDPDGCYAAIPSRKWHYRGPDSGDTLRIVHPTWVRPGEA